MLLFQQDLIIVIQFIWIFTKDLWPICKWYRMQLPGSYRWK